MHATTKHLSNVIASDLGGFGKLFNAPWHQFILGNAMTQLAILSPTPSEDLAVYYKWSETERVCQCVPVLLGMSL
jgi:hypothetical protein